MLLQRQFHPSLSCEVGSDVDSQLSPGHPSQVDCAWREMRLLPASVNSYCLVFAAEYDCGR